MILSDYAIKGRGFRFHRKITNGEPFLVISEVRSRKITKQKAILVIFTEKSQTESRFL